MLRLFGREGELEELINEKVKDAVNTAEKLKKEVQEAE